MFRIDIFFLYDILISYYSNLYCNSKKVNQVGEKMNYNKAMEYRLLGRTNLKTSVVGLGGEWFNGKTQEVVSDVISTAINSGINYIDVFMPQAETRTMIGNALSGKRDAMYIQGHLCTTMVGDQYERTRDINEVKSSFEDLLTRLQTNFIDVGMIHYVDSFEDFDIVFNGEIIEYAKKLKSDGIIGHIGLSSHNPLVALKAVETGLIDVLMFSINPAYDLEHANADIFEMIEHKNLKTEHLEINADRQALYTACERLGVGITVMKALGAGSLLREDSSPFSKAMTVTQCIHYCLTRPGVTSVLLGVANPEEVKTATAYCTATEKERDYTFILSENTQITMSGRCMYCNHCQPCPSNINIAAVTKFLNLAKEQSEVPETVRSHYNMLEKNATDCVMCGKCEPNCPFGVKIRENMKQAQDVFK